MIEIPHRTEHLIAAALRAAGSGRVLIQRGGRVIIAPSTLPGWSRVGVRVGRQGNHA